MAPCKFFCLWHLHDIALPVVDTLPQFYKTCNKKHSCKDRSCGNFLPDCRDLYPVSADKPEGYNRLVAVWHYLADGIDRCSYPHHISDEIQKADGLVLPAHGMAVRCCHCPGFKGTASAWSGLSYYRWIILYRRCNFLCQEGYEVQSWDMAPVCSWRKYFSFLFSAIYPALTTDYKNRPIC